LSEEVISQACRNEMHTECSGSIPVASGSTECQYRCHTPGTRWFVRFVQYVIAILALVNSWKQ